MRLILSESELERSRRIADTRNSKNGEVPNMRETRSHSDWEIHYAGVRAEIAVCKLLKFPVDEHFSFNGDSGAPDLYYGEYRVEVKAATYDPPILKLNKLTDFRSDLIVLCLCGKEESFVDLAGIVSRQRFAREHYTHDFGYGVRVCMDASQLAPIGDFLEWHNTKLNLKRS